MKSSKIKAILYPTAPMKTMIHMKTKPAPKKPIPNATDCVSPGP